MAGGNGTRLWPLTLGLSKQLLPVYDKPLIYYPLSTLMQCSIRDILIISTPQDTPIIKGILGNGDRFGIKLNYIVQESPKGIAQGIDLAKNFIGNDNFALILGDNIFYGLEFINQLNEIDLIKGALVFAYKVHDASRYGVVELDLNQIPISICEKPLEPKSNLALTGLYFFDNSAISIASNLKPSKRGEIEITEVLTTYLKNKTLNVLTMPVGTAWLDAGTPKSLQDAGNYVRIIEDRQGIKIACPEEIAFTKGWITKETMLKVIASNKSSDYSEYLNQLIKFEHN
jgi:glucose-1-phosphate thymidylyltransferase